MERSMEALSSRAVRALCAAAPGGRGAHATECTQSSCPISSASSSARYLGGY
jgi:hypothetical protein